MNEFLKCKDYLVSKEEFSLVWNTEKDILVTTPKLKFLELEKYYQNENYISHTDSKKNALEYLYYWVKRISLRRKLRLINHFFSDRGKLLDVGCGTGDFLKTAATYGWEVMGIEPNEKARSLATHKKLLVKDIPYMHNDLKEKQFDLITLWHVLEHMPTLDEDIEKLYQLLKPNGILMVAVPNFLSYDAQYYKEYWAGYDVPRHIWHFSQKGMQRIMKKYSFKCLDILPMQFDAYYVSLLSEKNKYGKQNWLRAFYNGWRSNCKAKKTTEYSSLIYCFSKI